MEEFDKPKPRRRRRLSANIAPTKFHTVANVSQTALRSRDTEVEAPKDVYIMTE